MYAPAQPEMKQPATRQMIPETHIDNRSTDANDRFEQEIFLSTNSLTRLLPFVRETTFCVDIFVVHTCGHSSLQLAERISLTEQWILLSRQFRGVCLLWLNERNTAEENDNRYPLRSWRDWSLISRSTDSPHCQYEKTLYLSNSLWSYIQFI